VATDAANSSGIPVVGEKTATGFREVSFSLIARQTHGGCASQPVPNIFKAKQMSDPQNPKTENRHKAPKDLRKQFLIDRNAQFGIACGLALFWLSGMAFVASFPLAVMAFYSTLIANLPADEVFQRVWDAGWYPLIMTFMLIPAGIWYSIKFSNRIAGPVFRVNRELKKLIAGDETREIFLRDKDYFKDLGDTFNELRGKVLAMQQEQSQTESGDGFSSAAVPAAAANPGATALPVCTLGGFPAANPAGSGGSTVL
jgi:methyl-accepting chemotaxis protein